MTPPEVTKTELNKIIPNVWIENGPVFIIWSRDRPRIVAIVAKLSEEVT
jgi:hypothetical protein